MGTNEIKNDESIFEKPVSPFPQGLKGGSCFLAVVGIICLFSALLLALNEVEDIEKVGRLGGSGLMLLFLGPTVMLHFFIFRTSNSLFHKFCLLQCLQSYLTSDNI